MTLGDARVTADGIVLIRNPDNQYDVEGRGGVIEELRHDGFHSCRKAGLQGLMAMQINQSSGGFSTPTSARMTVSKGAMGNRADTLYSSICSRSTEKENRVFMVYSNLARLNDFTTYKNKDLVMRVAKQHGH